MFRALQCMPPALSCSVTGLLSLSGCRACPGQPRKPRVMFVPLRRVLWLTLTPAAWRLRDLSPVLDGHFVDLAVLNTCNSGGSFALIN